MCSVVTNLVTSVELKPIRCATTLRHLRQTRNVAIPFILLSRIAEISATSGYVVVSERFGQNDEPASKNEERTKQKPIFFPAVDLIDAICKHM